MSAPCFLSESCPALCRCRASPPTSTGAPTSTRRSRTNGYTKRSENSARGCDSTPATPVPRSHVDGHERGSTEDPDEPLLPYLQERLQRADVAYLRPPVRIAGGFDTRIYALRVAHVPPAFSGRLIVRIFPETTGGQRATAEGALQNALADPQDDRSGRRFVIPSQDRRCLRATAGCGVSSLGRSLRPRVSCAPQELHPHRSGR